MLFSLPDTVSFLLPVSTSLSGIFLNRRADFYSCSETKISTEKSIIPGICDETDESGMNKLTIKGQFESRIFPIPRLNTIEAQKTNRVVSVPDQQIRAQWLREPTHRFALAAIPQDPALCPPMA